MKFIKFVLLTAAAIAALGFLVPERFVMPVEGASRNDYNSKSYWFYPWGKSVTHKGVDVFAKWGTPVVASVTGVVVAAGERGPGGKFVVVLGPKWRVHYFAHLHTIDTAPGTWVTRGERIGSVGDSGNAKGKAPHLHFSIGTLVPYPWRIDDGPHGFRKMWYLDPTPRLDAATAR